MSWMLLIQLCFARIGHDCAPGQRLFTVGPERYATFEACARAAPVKQAQLVRWLKLPGAVPAVICMRDET